MVSMFLAVALLCSREAAPTVTLIGDVAIAKKPPKGAVQPLYSVGFVCDSCGLPLRTVLDSIDKFALRYRDSFAVLAKANPGVGGDFGFGLELTTNGSVDGSSETGGPSSTRPFRLQMMRELMRLDFRRPLANRANVLVAFNLGYAKKVRRPDRFLRKEEVVCGIGTGDCGGFPAGSSLMMPSVCDALDPQGKIREAGVFLGGEACLRNPDTVLAVFDRFAQSLQAVTVWEGGITTAWWGDLSMRLDLFEDGRSRRYTTLSANSSDDVLRELVSREIGILRFNPIDSGKVFAFYRFSK
ncbi:MAG: hypothetical protein IPK50_04930 [Fibrobacterota bacterium]|nr:MAG: hypothetical protein IPK50_04930 [Fibrobacterota bacterium]